MRLTYRYTCAAIAGLMLLNHAVAEAAFTAPSSISAGADKTLYLPTNSATIVSTITSTQWTSIKNQGGHLYWRKISGPTNTYNVRSEPKVTVSNLLVGTYTFRIEVRSNTNAVVKYDDINIYVKKSANLPPKVSAGADKTLTLPTHSISISGSSVDPDGYTKAFKWTKVSGPAAGTLSGTTTAKLSLSGLVAGTYVFKLTASDNLGLSASDSMSLMVSNTSTQTADSRAGKLHIWDRSSGYDAAVFLPNDYGVNPSKKYPVVISLTGIGGSTLSVDHKSIHTNPEGFIRQLHKDATLRSTFQGIVIAPHGRAAGVASGDVWWRSYDLHDLVLDAISEYKINADKVTLAGLSSGGAGVNTQIKEHRDTYAGAVIHSMGPPSLPSVCDVDQFPIWAAGLELDGIFKYTNWKTFQTKIKSCSGYAGLFKLSVIIGAKGHGGWDTFYARPDVQQWLISQVRK